MATVNYSPGDVFKVEGGCGVVLPDGSAYIITVGGRGGHVHAHHTRVPEEATPNGHVNAQHGQHYEQWTALKAAWTATNRPSVTP